MQVSVQKLSPVLVEFNVSVPADRVKSELDKAYTSVARNARVRGFRPGKAPRKVLAHMFGSRVAADVAQRLVDDTFMKAVGEHKLQPVSSPDFEQQKIVESQPFVYKVRFEIAPEIESVKFEGLKAKRPGHEVSAEMIDAEIDKLREMHSTLEAPEKVRPVQKGDVVTLDFDVEVDGAKVPDAGARDFQVELGKGHLIVAIEEALYGKMPGERTEVEVQIPESHRDPALRGKQAAFHLSIHDLKEPVLPAVDDEFAKDLGDFDTLEEFKKDLKKRLEKQMEERADNAVAEQLVQELVAANPIPLPPSLVQRQSRVTEQEVLARARRQGTQTQIDEELRARIKSDSEHKVRAGLLMAEIAKKQGLQIGDPEIEEGLKELAAQSGKNIAKLRAEYRDDKKREMLVGMILEDKVLDILESKAQIENA